LKVAVTAAFAVNVTLQAPVPEQAPDQPAKVDPALATAVRVTIEPAAKLALHVAPQSIPEGLLVTLPAPAPARDTLRTGSAVTTVKVAVAVALFVSETVQDPVPEHAPDQPAKVELDDGVAVRVTDVPLSKLALQVAPQLIPDGLLVTVPEPVPLTCTLSWTEFGVAEEPMVPPPQPIAKESDVKQPQTRSIR